jgi:hypothetical protein
VPSCPRGQQTWIVIASGRGMLNEQVPPPVTPRPSKPARTRNPGQDPPCPQPPPPQLRAPAALHREARHRTPISGSIKDRVLTRAEGRCECCGAGCCLANPASKGTGGGPHPAQEPWRLGRLQQPAVPLLPLQRRQAMGGGLCVLRAGGQRPGAAGKRFGSCASPMPTR